MPVEECFQQLLLELERHQNRLLRRCLLHWLVQVARGGLSLLRLLQALAGAEWLCLSVV